MKEEQIRALAEKMTEEQVLALPRRPDAVGDAVAVSFFGSDARYIIRAVDGELCLWTEF